MGLFDKKTCDFCGGNIGMLGNKKYAEGNMCKECAGKLSPWYKSRKQASKAELDEQLAYREQNRQAVQMFQTTRSIGNTTKLLIDDNARKFMVTSASDLMKANPDVLDFSQATGCTLDMQESRHELKQTKDGKQVSYNPPRYEYSYDFHVNIHVSTPYFNEISYSLSNGYVKVGERSMSAGNRMMGAAAAGWSVRSSSVGIRSGEEKFNEYVMLGEEIKNAVYQMAGMAPPQGGFAPGMQGGYGVPVQGAGFTPQWTPQGQMQPQMQPQMQSQMQGGYGMPQQMPQGMPMQGQMMQQPQMAQGMPMQQSQMQPQMQQPQMQAATSCPFCQAQIAPGTRFCTSCGGQVA
ncbi:MAG: DUF4428 domain-containing protein [Lachnospiraceae bacterium]|nr:DUF4428 domain-containing protein [Lachnospiraceae bacterium]